MDCWNRKCVRNFGIISVLLVLATLLLFGSICKNCYGTSACDTTSVYRINHELVQMNRQSVAHLSMSKKSFFTNKGGFLEMEIGLYGDSFAWYEQSDRGVGATDGNPTK